MKDIAMAVSGPLLVLGASLVGIGVVRLFNAGQRNLAAALLGLSLIMLVNFSILHWPRGE